VPVLAAGAAVRAGARIALKQSAQATSIPNPVIDLTYTDKLKLPEQPTIDKHDTTRHNTTGLTNRQALL